MRKIEQQLTYIAYSTFNTWSDLHYVDDDLKRLSEWATEFLKPIELAKMIKKNYDANQDECVSDLSLLAYTCSTPDSDYGKAGLGAADLFTTLFGKVPPSPSLKEVEYSLF